MYFFEGRGGFASGLRSDRINHKHYEPHERGRSVSLKKVTDTFFWESTAVRIPCQCEPCSRGIKRPVHQDSGGGETVCPPTPVPGTDIGYKAADSACTSEPESGGKRKPEKTASSPQPQVKLLTGGDFGIFPP
jgi:hypothetical protein